MLITKKCVLFILASLPFHAHGQPSCVDNPDFIISPLNSNLRKDKGCSWITRRPTATSRRVRRVCDEPDISRNCEASCTDCTPPPTTITPELSSTPTPLPTVAPTVAPSSPVNLSAHAILGTFFDATTGAGWAKNVGWGSAEVCDYFGVICRDNVVVDITLVRNGLTGSIPSELGQLSSIEILSLAINSLTGSIPSELGQLGSLARIDLSFNSLTGSIPSELGQSTNFVNLNLSDNDLTGSIPSELAHSGSLSGVSLKSNSLTGSIPSELGQLSLRVLFLAGNEFTGIIPSEVCELDIPFTSGFVCTDDN